MRILLVLQNVTNIQSLFVLLATLKSHHEKVRNVGCDCSRVTCKNVVVILPSEERHDAGRQSDLLNFSSIRVLQRDELREIKIKITNKMEAVIYVIMM